ncbi:MAG: hypothetical protein H6R23_2700 [Proteobacteria bacterium]|nr:hypothetical protein [Pseudomonadota bacterium]
MGLNALDYVFFTNNQLHHQQWLEQTHFRTRELQQQLAEQAGAHQGYRAIVRALLDAYKSNDWVTIEAILGNHGIRNGIYHSAFNPTYNSLKPSS